jgi:hypothetical protein
MSTPRRGRERIREAQRRMRVERRGQRVEAPVCVCVGVAVRACVWVRLHWSFGQQQRLVLSAHAQLA